MSDYPMLISNKLHSFRNFMAQSYNELKTMQNNCHLYFPLFYGKILIASFMIFVQLAIVNVLWRKSCRFIIKTLRNSTNL